MSLFASSMFTQGTGWWWQQVSRAGEGKVSGSHSEPRRLLQGSSVFLAIPTIPFSTKWVNNLKETNSLAFNNPVNFFQCTTGSLMWKNQISSPLQHLFLAITMCYLFSLQKTAGESSCHFNKIKKKDQVKSIIPSEREFVTSPGRS